jgi:hypothetical protein
VYIVALQEADEGSRICTCPMDLTYKKLQVAYVAASSLAAVDAIRLENTDRTEWEARFLKVSTPSEIGLTIGFTHLSFLLPSVISSRKSVTESPNSVISFPSLDTREPKSCVYA